MDQLKNQNAYEAREFLLKHMPKLVLIAIGLIIGACLGAWF